MNFHSSSIPLLLAVVLAAGCIDRAKPRQDVTATSLAEAESLRSTATFLDLSKDTAMTAFPVDLGSYPALRRVSVRGQKTAADVPESVSEAKGLVELDLAGTGLRDLPGSLVALTSLRHLYLSDNGLTAVPGVVSKLSSLDYLNLDRNKLSALPADIGALTGLKWVRLNSNALTDLPESCADWKSIRRLYLRGNSLTALPPVILKMTSLEELDLGENKLTEIPDELCKLPNLHRIDLDGNAGLTALPPSMNAKDMPQLSHLFVFRCGLPTNEIDRVRAAYPDPVRNFIAF